MISLTKREFSHDPIDIEPTQTNLLGKKENIQAVFLENLLY
jgi:hypothetical protein